jgi:putative ABC transport system substrate-binding protein
MRRREFISGLGSAVAWPKAAWAQQPAIPVIGLLSVRPISENLAGFHRGLAEAGFVEGKNVTIEHRWAGGQNDRLPELASDLVRRRAAVIVTLISSAAALAAKSATQTIPIVFGTGGDPVELGLVKSLNRPGGNLTGVSILSVEVAAKRLELLHELLPATKLIGLLVNPANRAGQAETRELQAAANVLGVRLLILNASNRSEIETAFATLVHERAAALMISGDFFLYDRSDQIIALAARHAMPTVGQLREFAATGGLMAYGPNLQDAWRLVGNYTGRILMGEVPADLPVQRPTKFLLALNHKTAKALGLTIPETLLATADEVIQ